VNRRVAEHKKNKASHTAGPDLAREHRSDPASRAAQAAARVAARYANAPSYNEVLANEARAAMHAAEAASRAARVAHAAAQSVLDSLEAASAAESAAGSEGMYAGNHASAETAEFAAKSDGAAVDQTAYDASEHEGLESSEEHAYAVRWEPELPTRRSAPVPVRTRPVPSLFDSAVQDWPEPGSPLEEFEEGIEVVEPAEPIHGNLIEFPRQLVATRKVRPRRVEGPLAAAGEEAQLSIFEVDPGAICIEPEAPQPVHELATPAWSEPEWSGMQLDAHPENEESAHEAAKPAGTAALQLASASRRLMAVVVDISLVTGTFLLLAMLVASKMTQLPGPRAMEVAGCVALLLAAAGYQMLFFALARSTPGMYYAQLSLCTFEGDAPTRAQRNARLVALLLSALPMGLGLAWAIFDDDHLAWHDRLSHTYLRRC
jgi:uncharacterized RDD family membrane protein YckC